MTAITPKLEKYVSEARDFYAKHGKWPTIAELASQSDRPRQVVHKAAKKLEEAGLVVLTNEKPSRVSVAGSQESKDIPKRWWRILLCDKCQLDAIQPEGKKPNLREARLYEALGVVESYWSIKKRFPTAEEVGLHILIPKQVKNAGLRSKTDSKKFIAGGHLGKKNRTLQHSSRASGHKFLKELAERGFISATTGKPKKLHVEGECLRCSGQIHSMDEHQQHMHDKIKEFYGDKKYVLEKLIMEFHGRNPKPSSEQIEVFLRSLPSDLNAYVSDEGFESVKTSVLYDFAARLKKSKARDTLRSSDDESSEEEEDEQAFEHED